MEAHSEQTNTTEMMEFSTSIFNVTNEPDDFTIILSNIKEEAEIDLLGRRC